MNLAEFLYKIKPANIYNKDLITPPDAGDDFEKIWMKSNGPGAPRIDLDEYKINIRQRTSSTSDLKNVPTVTVNLLTVSALLEETMNIMEKCKYYERELDNRDLII